MPWRESDKVTERMKFMARLSDGERMTDLCKEFGISRQAGYKLRARYERDGACAMRDASRRPRSSPQRTLKTVMSEVLRLRKKRPTWGPKKLKARLHDLHPEGSWPAASTIGAMLKDEGLVKGRSRNRRSKATPTPLRNATAPNELWCMDYKGEFRLGNRQYCYPLTVTDQRSRFLLACEALEGTRTGPTQEAFLEVFREYGLPSAIRSDNGAPFASTGRMGLSKLAVWLMRLGIELERIVPGHPEQNGRHERMHLTLKQDTTRPAGNNFLQQQEKFDVFRQVFNEERPHEALSMKPPSSVYQVSERRLPEELEPLQYPLHDHTRPVAQNGSLHLIGVGHVYIGAALAGENIDLRQLEEGTWLVTFMDLDFGYLDTETRKIIDRPTTLN